MTEPAQGSADRLSSAEIVRRWPLLFHMAEAESWPSIQRHGLLSTTALLDLFELGDEQRRGLEEMKRSEPHRLEHRVYGTAVIRDNKPINETVLRRTLRGMTEPAWYRTVNGRVFFWLSERRLDRLRATAMYRDRAHDLLVLSTERLLARYADVVELSPYNSGAVHAGSSVPRGDGTFARITDYPWVERLSTSRREPVAELTVPYAVPDVADYVLEVRRLPPMVHW
jgi:hypothetical protein